MEDILKFLIIPGILIIGFIKQARKEAQNTSAPPRDDNDMPRPHETHPLPESWEGIPIPPPRQTDNTQTEKQARKQKAKPFIPQNYQTKQTVLHNQSVAQTPQTNRPEIQDTSPAINIQSAEEIRKGIIWSEILRKRY